MPYAEEYVKYKEKDPDYLKKDREYKNRFRRNNTAKTLLYYAKIRAKEKGFELNINLSDIDVPAVCPIFKTPFVYGTRQAASLDRINPSLGYVKGNIQVISRRANSMKSDASIKELKEFSSWVQSQSTV